MRLMSIYEAAGELEGQRSGTAGVNDVPVAHQSRGVTEPQRERPASNGIARRPESRGFPDNRIFREKCAAGSAVKKAPSGFFDKLRPSPAPRIAARGRAFPVSSQCIIALRPML